MDPEELANIVNKKHKQQMDDRLSQRIRSKAIASTPGEDKEGKNTTAGRTKPEESGKGGQTRKKRKKKEGK
ncbi:DUF4049 domain-containing protein, partial [Escherichia coli]|uniref:DUF4049 domain-containing protein n=1 Tax=Escherichia coli TaxID=562 RepID=UPI0029282B94|nr:DUF4049 domain-containing protein [Escherichia coli]